MIEKIKVSVTQMQILSRMIDDGCRIRVFGHGSLSAHLTPDATHQSVPTKTFRAFQDRDWIAPFGEYDLKSGTRDYEVTEKGREAFYSNQ
jgi:hypothetical protein